ncbi:UDP-N-acetyl-D-mannosamine dehydrogenase [Mesorhizobium sp. 8]|uniref:UDP-N-acetyl-D-mannosamine dehydrogenase n=1 Tax=Mesorhizobium sp. 8 TaxID=2584466 RepID=UPI00112493D5|nr:UDP-N-acetyl-D-mannosamine dehydrogenase [Mesorhizobium sp. 8]QDC02947.1 UDP-N-acetyl-D-mannosamine dehydrogenase [Mesorhizobium sp. 8]
MQPIRKVAVVGLGYVGLPTAAVIARSGLEVVGVDINKGVVDTVNDGRIHIAEHDLEDLVREGVKAGRLRATVSPEPVDAFMIAVPTPVNGDNTPNMTLVDNACAAIAPVLKKGDIVIIESTSTVGTTERAADQFARARPDLTFPKTHPETSDVLMAYCPERILPGATLRELVENARIIGGLDGRSAVRAKEVYGHFVKGEMMLTYARAAEMAKLTENAFRDVNIAFANELSMVCEELDIDVWSVIHAANLHPRVNILQPGAGVGGHCIPVDPWFIINQAPKTANLMRTARLTNHEKTHRVVGKIVAAAENKDTPIALLGLSYKPDIDDLRESPSLEILDSLLEQNFRRVMVVEPNISRLPAAYEGKAVALVDLEKALGEAEVVAILVNHSDFRSEKERIKDHGRVIDPVGALR